MSSNSTNQTPSDPPQPTDDDIIWKDAVEVVSQSEWTEGPEIAPHHKAKLVLRDPRSGIEKTYRVSNLFGVGFTVQRQDKPRRDISCILRDAWVTIEGEVLETWVPDEENIKQKGIIACESTDEPVEMPFVVWKKGESNELTEGEELRLESVVVNSFDGEKYFSISSNTERTPLSEVDREAEEQFDELVEQWLRIHGPIATEKRTELEE